MPMLQSRACSTCSTCSRSMSCRPAAAGAERQLKHLGKMINHGRWLQLLGRPLCSRTLAHKDPSGSNSRCLATLLSQKQNKNINHTTSVRLDCVINRQIKWFMGQVQDVSGTPGYCKQHAHVTLCNNQWQPQVRCMRKAAGKLSTQSRPYGQQTSLRTVLFM